MIPGNSSTIGTPRWAVVLAALLLAGAWAVRAEDRPAAGDHASRLLAAADLLQAWVDARDCPWPPRPVAATGALPLDPLWTRLDARWSSAGPALRSAYAELAYVRALKADQWRLLSGQAGTPATDAYFRALTSPLSRALLVLDDLQRLIDLVEEETSVPPEEPTAAVRELLAGLPLESVGSAALDSLLPCLPTAFRPGASAPTCADGEAALALALPAVRHGADLAVLLPALATATAPSGVPRFSLLLHQQDLPLLEVAFPGEALAQFRAGTLGLPGLWRAAALVPFTHDAPLAPQDFLLTSAEMPPGGEYAAPQDATVDQALEAAGLQASSYAACVQAAAWQELSIPPNRLRLVAVLASDPATARQLQDAAAQAPCPPGEVQQAWSRGPVVVWARGPETSVEAIVARLGQVLPLAQRPPVTVPPPVQAVLQPGNWPPPLSVKSCLTRVLICRTADKNNRPQGIAETFPAGLEQVGVYLEIGAAAPQTTLLVQWYRDDRLLHVHEAFKAASKTSRFISLAATQGNSLRGGDWRVELYQNGVKVEEKAFKIEGIPDQSAEENP